MLKYLTENYYKVQGKVVELFTLYDVLAIAGVDRETYLFLRRKGFIPIPDYKTKEYELYTIDSLSEFIDFYLEFLEKGLPKSDRNRLRFKRKNYKKHGLKRIKNNLYEIISTGEIKVLYSEKEIVKRFRYKDLFKPYYVSDLGLKFYDKKTAYMIAHFFGYEMPNLDARRYFNKKYIKRSKYVRKYISLRSFKKDKK